MKSPLLRNVLAAVAGYVSMFASAFVAFSLVWWILRPEGAFRAESWDVSGAWIVAAIVVGLVAAVIGGLLCARLQANRHGVHLLIVIVVLMSLLSALPDAAPMTAGPRPAGVGMFDAMSNARQPGWLLWFNPILGIVGVLIGARLGRRKDVATV